MAPKMSAIILLICSSVLFMQTNAQYCVDSTNEVTFQEDTERTFGDLQECSGYPLYAIGDLRLCGWLDGVGAETLCWETQSNEVKDLHHTYETRNFHCIPEKEAGEGLDLSEGDYWILGSGVTDFECVAGSDRCFLECKGLDTSTGEIMIDSNNHTEICGGNPKDIAVACVDVDECRIGAIRDCTGPSHARDCDIGPACGPNTKCANTIGNYVCSCVHDGFAEATADNAYIIDVGCVDVDECASGGDNGDCPDNSNCHNTEGSYYCECHYGYLWNEVTRVCDERQCEEPPNMQWALLDGNLAPNDFTETRKYQCDPGYEPSYSAYDVSFTMSCRPDGQWCHCQPPGCRRKSCGLPIYDGHALTDPIPGVFEDWLQYNCETGFNSNGNSFYKIKCLEGGWQDPTDKCTDTDECLLVGSCPDGAKCVNTIGSYHCLCKLGYTEDLPQGKQCTKIECPAVTVENGALVTESSADNRLFGSTLTYRCDEGYRVSTRITPTQATQEFEITCTLDGTWNPFPIPECIPISCGDPGIIDYSIRTGPFFYYEDWVEYRCLDGFRPSDNNGILTTTSFRIQCQSSGQWTEKASCVNINECKEKTQACGFPEEQYCIDTLGDYLCVCPPGWRLTRDGRDCEELPEDVYHPSGSMCDPFKLLGICNSGTCFYDGVGLPSCRCDTGFTGAFCDKKIWPQFTIPYILNLCAIVLGSIVLIVCIALMCYVCCKHLCKRANHPHRGHGHDHEHVYGLARPRVGPVHLPIRMGHKRLF